MDERALCSCGGDLLFYTHNGIAYQHCPECQRSRPVQVRRAPPAPPTSAGKHRQGPGGRTLEPLYDEPDDDA